MSESVCEAAATLLDASRVAALAAAAEACFGEASAVRAVVDSVLLDATDNEVRPEGPFAAVLAADGSAAKPSAAVPVAVALTAVAAVAAIAAVSGVKGESDSTKSDDGDMSDSALARAASEPPVVANDEDEEMTRAASAGDRDEAVEEENRR